MAAAHALRDEEDLLVLSTPGRDLLLLHLFSSAWRRYAAVPHHPACPLAPQRLMGWTFSVVLASSNANLQKKNKGFMPRKEALKI